MDDIIFYSPGDERRQCYRCFINLSPRARVTSTEGEALKYRPEYDLKVIGENLRRLRIEKSLSVDEVREYLRLGSVQAVYKYEKGKSYPQADTMFALMELYEANLSDITCKHEDRVSSYREEGLEPSFAFSWRCIFLMGVHRLFCKLLPAFLYHRLEVYYNVS